LAFEGGKLAFQCSSSLEMHWVAGFVEVLTYEWVFALGSVNAVLCVTFFLPSQVFHQHSHNLVFIKLDQILGINLILKGFFFELLLLPFVKISLKVQCYFI
jgi:hypothetical protein